MSNQAVVVVTDGVNNEGRIEVGYYPGQVRDAIVYLMSLTDPDTGLGLSYAKIAELVRSKIPGARTTARSVACYKSYARKQSNGVRGQAARDILAVEGRYSSK